MLKSDMADAKKGDSFMRHNITKKVISAMLSGVLMLSLAGCGKAAKLPETVVNTSLVVEKNGKVVSYLVNTFDKDFYSLDGLTQMVQEEAEEFNAAHGDAAEPPMAVKTVQMLEEGDTVQVVQEFADTESYEDYNEGAVLWNQSGSTGRGDQRGSGTGKCRRRYTGGGAEAEQGSG